MTPRMVVLFLALAVGCSVASPIRPESNSGTLVGIPILVQEPATLEDGSPPMAYGLLLGVLQEPEVAADSSSPVEKRSAEENESDDLETAAGTYALRPLFVYRQQLAYRQRVRDAIRRRNRF